MSASAHGPHSSTAHAPPSSSAAGNSHSSHLNSPFRGYQLWQRAEYPKQVWAFVGASIGALVLCNIIYILRLRSRKSRLMKKKHATGVVQDTERSASASYPPSSLQRLLLAIEAGFKIGAFRWTLPYGLNYVLSLSEMFFTVGYLGMIMIWNFVYSYGGEQAFWAQRAGAIAYKQFPLLPLLAGKNDFVTLATGVSYEKINIMHRAVARTLFILVMLHTFTKVQTFTPAKLAAQNYATGTMATVAFAAIFLTSVRPVRTHAFELFLILHICLISVFWAGMYFHPPDDALFVWLFIGFWAFDRVGRGVRLFFINRGLPESHDAIVEAISQDSVRLTLPNRHITWKAGQHVFLVLPGVSTIPFEAHPFTIANIQGKDSNGRNKMTDLVFYIRAMDGFTRKLHDYAAAHQGGTVSAFVDGPYGVPPPVNTFSTVILIAGGSGVSFTAPLLLDIISRSCMGLRRHLSGCHRCTGAVDLDLRIHITAANGLVPTLSHESSGKLGPFPISPTEKQESLYAPAKESRPDITVVGEEVSTQGGHFTPPRHSNVFKTRFGRPDLVAMIREEIEASLGPISVNACGPTRLTNAVRIALRSGPAGPSAILRGGAPVSMHIENFGAVRSNK